jgi:hypothetical protein
MEATMTQWIVPAIIALLMLLEMLLKEGIS